MGVDIDFSDLILKLENINKSFPGVKALQNMQIELARGEMHAVQRGRQIHTDESYHWCVQGRQRPDVSQWRAGYDSGTE